MLKKRKTIALIVPTGIGASIGGFAGDASCVARKFAEKFQVIVNPNVVNAACFSGITKNMLYTEGWTITQLFKGNLSLVPAHNNKIGVVFDKGISKRAINVHINTINAVKTVYGTNIIGYKITDEICGVKFFNTTSGISSGCVENPETLLKSAKELIKDGADAIAVVCKFEEPPEDGYKFGNAVDIVGGIEAVISHYLSSQLFVPVAHSPAFENMDITSDIVDARASAEYITPTFLPCILLGLQNAPLISLEKRELNISNKNISTLVMPYNSLGSSIVADSLKNGIKVFAVKENSSVLNITKKTIFPNSDIIEVDTYNECYKILLER